MWHKQPPTPMQTEKTTAHGLDTNNIAIKRLWSMDMRLHCLRYRATQGKSRHYWRAEATNLGDYVTKHHAAIHHQTVRNIFLTPKSQLDLLRTKTKIKGKKLRKKNCSKVVLDLSVSTDSPSGLQSY